MTSSNSAIWNWDCIGICTMLGLALDPKQIQKVCHRFGLNQDGPDDVAYRFYLLHRCCHQKGGHLPKYLAKRFNERFADVVHKVRTMDEGDPAELLDDFVPLLETRPAALLWAMLTDSRERYRIFGHYLVHRFSYGAFRLATGAAFEVRSRQDELASMQRDLACSKRLAERHKRAADVAVKRLREAEKQEESLRSSSAIQCARVRELEMRPDEGAQLRKRVRELEHELDLERRRNKCLQVALSVVEEPESRTGLLPCPEVCANCEEPPGGCPLDALRVAVVGGLDRLEGRYREVVEALGADFDFHTGNCHGGCQTLKNMVCRSDIVVFFTPINSHSALNIVKGMCRKSGKRFVALARTGPQALADALREVA